MEKLDEPSSSSAPSVLQADANTLLQKPSTSNAVIQVKEQVPSTSSQPSVPLAKVNAKLQEPSTNDVLIQMGEQEQSTSSQPSMPLDLVKAKLQEPSTSDALIQMNEEEPSTSSLPRPLAKINIELQEQTSPYEINENSMDISSENEAQSSTVVDCSLDAYWTKDDKFQLYLGLKNEGSKNIEAIQEYLPEKSLADIKAAILHYKKRAQRTPEFRYQKSKIRQKKEQKCAIPLASWAKLLTDKLSFDDLQTDMVSALRLIAEFDNIPPPSMTENIDLRHAYHQIADAMEGKSLTNIRFISEMLSSCIFETALLSKSFIPQFTLKNIVSNVNFKENVPAFPKYSKNFEESVIRRLVSQKNYNPLGIPLSNLSPTGI